MGINGKLKINSWEQNLDKISTDDKYSCTHSEQIMWSVDYR